MRTTKKPARHAAVLASFVAYCKANPDERFWQALRNWAGAYRLCAWVGVFNYEFKDTFYWEGRVEDQP